MSADCRCELQLQLLYNLEMINYIFLFFCNEKWNCLLSAREREKTNCLIFMEFDEKEADLMFISPVFLVRYGEMRSFRRRKNNMRKTRLFL